MARTSRPFDAVLLISFGGPGGLDEIRPFLRNVLRGRKIPQSRIDAVAKHYELFDGVSPLTAITRRQADGLATRLDDNGFNLPVFIGMRNWHPFLDDTLSKIAAAGIARILAVILAPQHSYSSCGQYRQNVVDARETLVARGEVDVEVTYVGDWHTHPGFIAANAAHIMEALRRLPDSVRHDAQIIFTAHSIPTAMAEFCRYETELQESARAVAAKLVTDDWSLVYQSRSGRPDDPWLGPDICDYLRAQCRRGLKAAVIAPIGFVADHIEVLYDLDIEAAAVCEDLSLPMQRAAAVNDHPAFLDALADITCDAHLQAKSGRLLPIVPIQTGERMEGPPRIR